MLGSEKQENRLQGVCGSSQHSIKQSSGGYLRGGRAAQADAQKQRNWRERQLDVRQKMRRYRAPARRMSGLNRHISRTMPSRICCRLGSAIASSGELKGCRSGG